MGTSRQHIAAVLALLLCLPLLVACGIYSFTGTSIQPGVNTVTIELFEYKALRVNPTLAATLTDELKTTFRKMTKLEQVDMDGDIQIEGAITGYDVRAAAITANETAARSRLTVSVKISYTNRKYPEEDKEESFSAYAEFDATQSLDAVESTLCEEIVEQLCDLILNATVANW